MSVEIQPRKDFSTESLDDEITVISNTDDVFNSLITKFLGGEKELEPEIRALSQTFIEHYDNVVESAKKFVNDMLDKEVRKILQAKGSATRNELVDTIRNAFDAVYKVLWQKKDFWKTDIK